MLPPPALSPHARAQAILEESAPAAAKALRRLVREGTGELQRKAANDILDKVGLNGKDIAGTTVDNSLPPAMLAMATAALGSLAGIAVDVKHLTETFEAQAQAEREVQPANLIVPGADFDILDVEPDVVLPPTPETAVPSYAAVVEEHPLDVADNILEAREDRKPW